MNMQGIYQQPNKQTRPAPMPAPAPMPSVPPMNHYHHASQHDMFNCMQMFEHVRNCPFCYRLISPANTFLSQQQNDQIVISKTTMGVVIAITLILIFLMTMIMFVFGRSSNRRSNYD